MGAWLRHHLQMHSPVHTQIHSQMHSQIHFQMHCLIWAHVPLFNVVMFTRTPRCPFSFRNASSNDWGASFEQITWMLLCGAWRLRLGEQCSHCSPKVCVWQRLREQCSHCSPNVCCNDWGNSVATVPPMCDATIGGTV